MLSLFCFWFQGYWEQDDKAWRYFLRKLSSQISVERLIFCKSGTSYSESWAKQCSYCTVIATFSCNMLNCNVICVSPKNDRSNKKCLISTPVNKIFYFIVHLHFYNHYQYPDDVIIYLLGKRKTNLRTACPTVCLKNPSMQTWYEVDTCISNCPLKSVANGGVIHVVTWLLCIREILWNIC